ncbi:MAG: TRAP transporter large permease subunit [Albidovulum sp.]|nr:TRAP transporter large permease subunit [Albidovulum sp.]
MKDLPRPDMPSLWQFAVANMKALPAVAIPSLNFTGIYGGYTTIAEAGGLAALLSMLAAPIVYRGCTIRELLPITAVAMRRSASIKIIVVAALLFGHWLTETRMPAKLVEFVISTELNAWQFLLFMNLAMLVLGTILEGLLIVLITAPLVIPLFRQFGIDPVHYAIIEVINIELAMLAPPVGLNFFELSGVSKAPVSEVTRGVLPFLALMLLPLGLVAFIPELSLTLPSLFFD